MNTSIKIICASMITFGIGFILAGAYIKTFTLSGNEFLSIALGLIAIIIAVVLGIIPLAQNAGQQARLDSLASKVDALCRDLAVINGQVGLINKLIDQISVGGGRTVVPAGEFFTGTILPSAPRIKRSKA